MEKKDSLLDIMCRAWKLPAWWLFQAGVAIYRGMTGANGWSILGNFIGAFVTTLLISGFFAGIRSWQLAKTVSTDKWEVQVAEAHATVFADWDRALLEQTGIIAENAGKPGYDEKGNLRRVRIIWADPLADRYDPKALEHSSICSCYECEKDRYEERADRSA